MWSPGLQGWGGLRLGMVWRENKKWRTAVLSTQKKGRGGRKPRMQTGLSKHHQGTWCSLATGGANSWPRIQITRSQGEPRTHTHHGWFETQMKKREKEKCKVERNNNRDWCYCSVWSPYTCPCYTKSKFIICLFKNKPKTHYYLLAALCINRKQKKKKIPCSTNWSDFWISLTTVLPNCSSFAILIPLVTSSFLVIGDFCVVFLIVSFVYSNVFSVEFLLMGLSSDSKALESKSISPTGESL